MTLFKNLAPLMCALLVVGCGDDNASESEYYPPSEYAFSSRTNAGDYDSSVVNEEPLIQALMLNELMELMDSETVTGLVSAAAALDRLHRIYKVGTVSPTDGSNISLGYSNAYTGLTSTPTQINLQLVSGLPLKQEDFSEITQEVELYSETSLDLRRLPFTTSLEIGSGIVEVEVGDFIGWLLLDGVVDGNDMPRALLDKWLEETSLIMVSGNGPDVIDSSGRHLKHLIKQLTLGVVNYSSISQFNLTGNKGLLKQNAVALNNTDVEEQLSEVESKKAALLRTEELLKVSEETLDASLEEWKKADSDADPSLTFFDYESMLNYGPLSKAKAYYDNVEAVVARQTGKEDAERYLAEAEAKVETLLPYTDLAHNWDEAFGYFGASLDYGLRSDLEVVEQVEYDTNIDGEIDALSELNFGYAVMASERDAGAALTNTDFSKELWNAFLIGRQIIQQNHGREAVEAAGYHIDLKAHADTIVSTLEKVIAASVIHHMNQTIKSIEDGEIIAFTDGYYEDWSALKGIALTLQFNDAPSISKDELIELHNFIGDAPVALNGNFDAQVFDLREAKDILQQAYGFDAANVEAW